LLLGILVFLIGEKMLANVATQSFDRSADLGALRANCEELGFQPVMTPGVLS
jgi:hypothetical protein